MSRILISSLILVLIANLAMSDLVPRIDDRGVLLEPSGTNKYNLKIKHDDGSTLEVAVQKNRFGQYELRGRLNQPEYSSLGRLYVFYQKGPNGPETRYQYIQPLSESTGP